jgi:hypothetical protein
MKILYVARHNCGLNDDEGSISHGLQQLGHTVVKVQQDAPYEAKGIDADFCLFHKWENIDQLRKVCIPKGFWYFDLVDFPDVKLSWRNEKRKDWINTVTELSQFGFCTDGDWVEQDQTGKLHHLKQGASDRLAGEGLPSNSHRPIDLLLTAIRKGGKGRQRFVDIIRNKYGNRLHHVEKGLHGRHLAHKINDSKVVLAPDAPVTDFYWSNRVYVTLGFGGLLLHPYCKELAKEYKDGEEILFYHDMSELDELIDHYTDRPEDADSIRQKALKKTLKKYTYMNRCKQLIKVVEKIL